MKPVRLLWGVVLLAGLFAALPAAPANATTQTTVVSAVSANNSLSPKEVTVTCPAPSFPNLYGPGGAITGGGGNVSVSAVIPEGSPLNRVRVRAVELGAGTTDSWRVEAWAICGPFTANLHAEPQSIASSTARTKTANPPCPTNQALYGTGFSLNGNSTGDVIVHDVIPGPVGGGTPRSVTVRATARPGVTPSWGLTGYSICANPAPSMRVVQQIVGPDSNTTKSTTLGCGELPGTVPQGVGIQTAGPAGSGELVDGRIALRTNVGLFTTLGGAIATENGAVADSWRLFLYVICAN